MLNKCAIKRMGFKTGLIISITNLLSYVFYFLANTYYGSFGKSILVNGGKYWDLYIYRPYSVDYWKAFDELVMTPLGYLLGLILGASVICFMAIVIHGTLKEWYEHEVGVCNLNKPKKKVKK